MRRAAWVVSAGLVLVAACGGGDGEPTSRAGTFTVSLFAGSANAGALLLTVSGGAVESVTALGGQQISFSSPAAGTTKVVVLGTLQTGNLFTIRVPDTTRLSAYAVQVDQVADNVTFALLNSGAYSLSIHK